jgi:hypothetical protein
MSNEPNEPNETNETGFVYRPETYVRSSVNVPAFTWLAVLGIPVLLLFLIYSKVEERTSQPAAAPHAVQMEQAHH